MMSGQRGSDLKSDLFSGLHQLGGTEGEAPLGLCLHVIRTYGLVANELLVAYTKHQSKYDKTVTPST